MKRYSYILTLLALLVGNFAKSDSPLTSTPFWMAYEDVKEVSYAKENGLDEKVLKQLTGKKITCDVKLAMINSFGWGSGFTSKFEDYLLEKRKGLTRDVFKYLKQESDDMPEDNEQTLLLSTDDLVCWSYLRAMDNYDMPYYSMRGAFIAYWRDQKNMSAGVVWCLVISQMALMADWCKIWESSQQFIVEAKYETNLLREEAVTIIMEYMSLYEQDCN